MGRSSSDPATSPDRPTLAAGLSHFNVPIGARSVVDSRSGPLGRAHNARFVISETSLRISARGIHHPCARSEYFQEMARPKVHHEERVTTAFRLPRDLHQRLQDAAAERDLSANFLAVKALEEFLNNLVPADELRLTRVS